MIGLIDIDLMYTKNLSQPNYELCSVATYYKLAGKNVRLVVDLKIENLLKYEKIYVFKSHRNGLLPGQFIRDYYRLNAEEYGEGFPNRPLLPDIPELVYITPETDAYLPLINFLKKAQKPLPYKFTHETWFTKYQLTKCFLEDEEDLLVRDIPKAVRLLIYDDPILFFSTEKGIKLMQDMLQQNKILQFATPLDISKLSKEHYELLMTHSKFKTLRQSLYASTNNSNLKEFLMWCEAHKDKIKASRITIQLESSTDYRYYLLNGLRIMTELPERLGKKLKVYPDFNHGIRKRHYLLKYFYKWQRGRIGSFYEYIIWRTYHKEIDRHKLSGRIDAYTIDFLFKHYGMRFPLVKLEEIMTQFKEAETLIMRGGKSYYGTERRKYSFIGGTPNLNTTEDIRIRNKRTTTFGPGGLYQRSGAIDRAKESGTRWLPSERQRRDREQRELRNYKRK